MTQDKIKELADDYAVSFITEHTNIPVDGEKCRALVRAFVNFYKATEKYSNSWDCWNCENREIGDFSNCPNCGAPRYRIVQDMDDAIVQD